MHRCNPDNAEKQEQQAYKGIRLPGTAWCEGGTCTGSATVRGHQSAHIKACTAIMDSVPAVLVPASQEASLFTEYQFISTGVHQLPSTRSKAS